MVSALVGLRQENCKFQAILDCKSSSMLAWAIYRNCVSQLEGGVGGGRREWKEGKVSIYTIVGASVTD